MLYLGLILIGFLVLRTGWAIYQDIILRRAGMVEGEERNRPYLSDSSAEGSSDDVSTDSDLWDSWDSSDSSDSSDSWDSSDSDGGSDSGSE